MNRFLNAAYALSKSSRESRSGWSGFMRVGAQGFGSPRDEIGLCKAHIWYARTPELTPANSRRRADAGCLWAHHRIGGANCRIHRHIVDVDLDRAGGVRKSPRCWSILTARWRKIFA